MQPFGGEAPGLTLTFVASIVAASVAEMCPRVFIRSSTWLRRAIAFSGFAIGSSPEGLCTRPASIEAWGSVRSAAVMLK